MVQPIISSKTYKNQNTQVLQRVSNNTNMQEEVKEEDKEESTELSVKIQMIQKIDDDDENESQSFKEDSSLV
jgi:hypothetical protein